jgi:hypothetical protein
MALPENVGANVAENRGHVNLYGLEFRGIVGEGIVHGFASLGVSFGSGSLSQRVAENNGMYSVDSSTTGTLAIKPMPVLGFGAEVSITQNFAIGPMLRWYVISVDSACTDESYTTSYAGQTMSQTSSRCATDVSSQSVPDILYLGLGVSFYQH